MADIITGKIFVDGEKGITATKLNQIQSLAVIQPSFYSAKASSSTMDPTDTLLELKSSGSYAQISGANFINSVSTQLNATVTLRTFNSVGNPTFEVDARTCGAGAASSSTFAIDRWYHLKVGTMSFSVAGQQDANASPILLPGTNFVISQNFFRYTLGTQQATLGATDRVFLSTYPEGPQLRELIGDVHSLSILVRTSVAGLSFGISLQDNTGAHSLVLLATIPNANTWTLLTFPALPIWVAGGSFSLKAGTVGYTIGIVLAAGSTYVTPANGSWQAGNFYGALGQSNFAASALGSTFDIAYVSHVPGANCLQIDKPFAQNYDECLRYYQKSYDYAIVPGSITGNGMVTYMAPGATTYALGTHRFHKPMAKIPTVTLYNWNTGVAGSVQDVAGTNHAGATAANLGMHGFGQINYTGATAAANGVYAHYTSDTGW